MKKIMLFVYVFLLSFLFACSASKSPSMSDSAFLSAIETSVLDTAYQFSSVFEIKIFDRNKNLIEQQECEVNDIRPDTGYTVSIYLEKPWEADSWVINNYYTDIIC